MRDLTVIIPVYKPESQFDEMIGRIRTQTVKADRIMLLWTIPNDSIEADVKNQAKKYMDDNTEVIYIKQDDYDHGGTRNYGMSLVQTEYAVCMTQDALPADDKLFERLITALEDDNVSAAYARQLPRDNATTLEKITREFNYPEAERIQNKESLPIYGIKTYFCSDVCAMYSLKKYREAGGFVKKTIFNEDMLMAAAMINMGYTVRYVPEARVVHSHHYSCMEQYRRNFDLAVSHRQYSEVFDSVPSEGEGIRLVLTTAKKLIAIGKIYLIPELIIQSAFKYIGYRSGRKYTRLSKAGILKRTMNRSYWKDYNRSEGNE